MLEWRLDRIAGNLVAEAAWNRVAVNVTAAGDAILLYEPAAERGATFPRDAAPGGASFARPRMAKPLTFLVKVIAACSTSVREIGDIDLAYPQVDLLPDGQLVITGSRSALRGSGEFDFNGLIIGPDGQRQPFAAGDGIQAMQTDKDGRIWVSYFDEGVFGDGIGVGGLNCFNAKGHLLWGHNESEGRLIDDCYALNVSSEGTWFYYYSDFDLGRVDDRFQPIYWRTALRGCHAFAVAGERLVFSSQYKEPRSEVHVCERQAQGVVRRQTLHLTTGSKEWAEDAHIAMRGPYVHVFTSSDWFRGDIRDL